MLREDEALKMWRLFLYRLLPETDVEHQSGAGESEREGEPDACQSPIEYETEQVACRKGNDEIGDEGDVHHRLYIGNAAEGIGVGALHSVAELVDDERYDEACHHEGYFVVVRKPTADFIS